MFIRKEKLIEFLKSYTIEIYRSIGKNPNAKQKALLFSKINQFVEKKK